MSTKKKNILFVGAFKKSGKDGSTGGQIFACSTLINSPISEQINWIKIDSTADSNQLASLSHRLWKAAKRTILFIRQILFSKIDTVLIFTADGYSFLEKGFMALIARFSGKKVILAPRSGIVINDIENSKLMRWYIPFVIQRVNILVCQGEIWKTFYSNLTPNKPKETFVVIQNWIDISKYEFIKTKNHDSDNILFLSWVDKNKGIFDLIEVAYRIKDDFPSVNYSIAGDGIAMEESKARVEKLGLNDHFTFHSWVSGDSKYKLLKESSIYVLPSYFEGFPNSLMEAMVSECATLSTTVGSIPDLVSNNFNGLLFPKGNIDDFESKLRLLISDRALRNSLGTSAKETILRNNSIEIAVQKFKDLLLN